jgi:Squalene-hopene cyclase C-terminal domain
LGYAIDQKFLADAIEGALGSREKMIASKLVPGPKDRPDPRPIGRGVQMGTVFLAVAGKSLPSLTQGQQQSLRWIADQIVKKQVKDGSWEFFLSRPPINENQTTDGIWLLMALQDDSGHGASPAERVALEKGIAWLSASKAPETYQAKVLKVLLALRAGKSRGERQGPLNELLALQRPDGGWRQIPEMPSDAFATGQTLYVLSLAGDTAERPEIMRAIKFLVATQKPDGSWPMTSRATPDGRPGSAKLLSPITCAASSWAVLGLASFAPKRGL